MKKIYGLKYRMLWDEEVTWTWWIDGDGNIFYTEYREVAEAMAEAKGKDDFKVELIRGDNSGE
jgi:hypothetical protein